MQPDLNNIEPDIPVYLFTGFLEAGKTKFIQETLENYRFNRGERTLLLVCEEGELEYDPSRFIGSENIFIRTLDEESGLTEARMQELEDELEFERVMVEYNGMWNIDSFFAALPPRWMVAQEFSFADFNLFQTYNLNMRQQTYDKMKSCELIVFNRTPKGADIMEHHRIVRAANRTCTIAYEHMDGSVDYDDIEDPLPFDIEAPVVVIEDKDYAIWYRDM
ncbi:MAG: GTPase, partial [Firmicutes bacterium]|nr:GTPase [Bacillota bacterium]